MERDALTALGSVAQMLAATEAAVAAHEAAERVHDGRFFVACIGQFKRGKSTLLNSLVGSAVLPAGVVPVTSVVTVLRHGPELGARVRIGRDRWQSIRVEELEEYASETKNPENVKAVTGIEVFAPSPLLERGLCLIDTPGIGSIFEGNTEATRAFIPHIDAALVVVGADPPVSGEELRLVAQVAKDVHDFVFVLTKADRLLPIEVEQARSFSEAALAKVVPGAHLLVVSAVEEPKGRDWERLVATLTALTATRGSELVAAAEARAVARIAGQLRAEIAERRAALRRPIQESEERLGALRRSVATAEKLLVDAGPLFAGIEARLGQQLGRERDAFLAQARPRATERLVAVVRGGDDQAAAIAAAQEIARAEVEAWREAIAPAAEELYVDAVDDLVVAAQKVLAQIAATGDAALAAAAANVDLAKGFRVRPRFFFTEILAIAEASWWTGIRRAVGGRAIRERALMERARPYLLRLIESNAERATNDFIEQVRESRRRVESEIKRALRSVTTSATRAVEIATEVRQRGEEAVASEGRRLGEIDDRIAAILRPHAGQ